jgi:transcriptional regulator GlxA family with amidase domain
MERNLAQRAAETLLREYLETSTLALERLFQKCANCTPAQFLSGLWMQRAREIVVYGKTSVTATAFELGYKHANDLSRAFRWRTGKHLCRRRSLLSRPHRQASNVLRPASSPKVRNWHFSRRAKKC